MWLLRAALRNPISIVVIVIGVALCSVLALTRMPIDIFPNLNLPVIYVAQPYGGMSPAQMEGYLVYYYEYHFLYITGIESVESKSIQNVGLLKLTFHPGTDMSQAMAQTVGYVDRARAFMPPGTVAPFIMRFDAGSVPVGYLVFSSTTKSVAEIQDLALNRVRPLFATLPGVSAPPPFGGAARTIVVSGRIEYQRLAKSSDPHGSRTDSLFERRRDDRGFERHHHWLCRSEWTPHGLYSRDEARRCFDVECSQCGQC